MTEARMEEMFSGRGMPMLTATLNKPCCQQAPRLLITPLALVRLQTEDQRCDILFLGVPSEFRYGDALKSCLICHALILKWLPLNAVDYLPLAYLSRVSLMC